MAQAATSKSVSAEATLIKAVIENVKSGKYTIQVTTDETGTTKTLKDNVVLSITNTEKAVRKVLTIGDKEFSGKEVRALDKAIEKVLNPQEAKARGGKKKEIISEDEVADLLNEI